MVTTFHLNNRLANYQPKIVFCGSILKYDQTATYLGVTQDKQLMYKRYIIEQTADKIKSRNNIIQKLTDSFWGGIHFYTKNVCSNPSVLSRRVRLPSVVKQLSRW